MAACGRGRSAARAQQPAKLPTIGFLSPSTPSVDGNRVFVFTHRLRERGWIEGRSIAVEVRWAEGRSERFAEIAAELVRLKVDVIVTAATAPVIAAKQATSVIPIVFAERNVMACRANAHSGLMFANFRSPSHGACRPSQGNSDPT